MTDTPVDTARLIANFDAALRDYDSHSKSRHWDRFPDDWRERLSEIELWENFRSNGMTDGLETRWGHQAPAEATGEILDPNVTSRTVKSYEALSAIHGGDRIDALLECRIGNPTYVRNGDRQLNIVDLRLCNDALLISQYFTPAPRDDLVICEIGGGFGGLVAKLKSIYPTSRLIVVDLPEVNALQFAYLSQRFPDARISGYADIKELGLEAALSSSDILIAPAWCANALPDRSVDLFVNTRSMQEMNRSVVDAYIATINRSTKFGGGFFCVNRYWKATVGEPIRIKDYPFGADWNTLLSEPAFGQEWIHALYLTKCAPSKTPARSVEEIQSRLPPLEWSGLRGVTKKTAVSAWTIIWGGHHNINPGLKGRARALIRATLRVVARAADRAPRLKKFSKKIIRRS